MPLTITFNFFSANYFSGHSIFCIDLRCSSHFLSWKRHYTQMHGLSRVNQRSKEWVITRIVEILRTIIRLFIEETLFSGCCHCRQFKRTFSRISLFVCVAYITVPRRTTSDRMSAGRIFKVTTIHSFIQNCIPILRYFLSGQSIRHFSEIAGTKRNINCIQRRYYIRTCKEIINRFYPFIIIDSIDTCEHTHDSSYITNITVCIPTTHIADINRI